jgi:hypothetical protein
VYENLLPYFLCVVGGMALSAREVSRRLAPASTFRTSAAPPGWRSSQVAVMAHAPVRNDVRDPGPQHQPALPRDVPGVVLARARLPERMGARQACPFRLPEGPPPADGLHRQAGSFAKVREWIADKEPLGIYPVGVLSPEPPPPRPGGLAVPWLGTSADLPRVLEEKLVGQVIMLELPVNDDEASRVITACRDRGCRLLIHSNIEERYTSRLCRSPRRGAISTRSRRSPWRTRSTAS